MRPNVASRPACGVWCSGPRPEPGVRSAARSSRSRSCAPPTSSAAACARTRSGGTSATSRCLRACSGATRSMNSASWRSAPTARSRRLRPTSAILRLDLDYGGRWASVRDGNLGAPRLYEWHRTDVFRGGGAPDRVREPPNDQGQCLAVGGHDLVLSRSSAASVVGRPTSVLEPTSNAPRVGDQADTSSARIRMEYGPATSDRRGTSICGFSVMAGPRPSSSSTSRGLCTSGRRRAVRGTQSRRAGHLHVVIELHPPRDQRVDSVAQAQPGVRAMPSRSRTTVPIGACRRLPDPPSTQAFRIHEGLDPTGRLSWSTRRARDQSAAGTSPTCCMGVPGALGGSTAFVRTSTRRNVPLPPRGVRMNPGFRLRFPLEEGRVTGLSATTTRTTRGSGRSGSGLDAEARTPATSSSPSCGGRRPGRRVDVPKTPRRPLSARRVGAVYQR